MLVTTNFPWRRESVDDTCPHCGGDMYGGNDGDTPRHCENYILTGDKEPDSGPWYCTPEGETDEQK